MLCGDVPWEGSSRRSVSLQGSLSRGSSACVHGDKAQPSCWRETGVSLVARFTPARAARGPRRLAAGVATEWAVQCHRGASACAVRPLEAAEALPTVGHESNRSAPRDGMLAPDAIGAHHPLREVGEEEKAAADRVLSFEVGRDSDRGGVARQREPLPRGEGLWACVHGG